MLTGATPKKWINTFNFVLILLYPQKSGKNVIEVDWSSGKISFNVFLVHLQDCKIHWWICSWQCSVFCHSKCTWIGLPFPPRMNGSFIVMWICPWFRIEMAEPIQSYGYIFFLSSDWVSDYISIESILRRTIVCFLEHPNTEQQRGWFAVK